MALSSFVVTGAFIFWLFQSIAFSSGESENEVLDIEAIEDSVPNLHRPDFLGIPYLLQQVSSEGTVYIWVGAGSDVDFDSTAMQNENSYSSTGDVLLNRTSNDEGLGVIILKSFEYQFGPKLNRTYIVLRRHSVQSQLYFFNIVYVRNEGHKVIPEWESISTIRGGMTKAEKDLCQGDDCDFPEYIFGTCPIVSHKCKEKLKISPAQMEYKRFMVPEEHGQLLPWVDVEEENPNRRKRSMGTYNTALNETIANSTATKNNTSLSHIPNSFDLLEMDKSGSDYTFKNSVKRKRNATEQTQKQGDNYNFFGNPFITCFDCGLLGPFYNDLEENPIYSEGISNDFKMEFEQLAKENPSIPPPSLAQVPFIGYGNCTYNTKLSGFKRPISFELDDIIEFYLSTLRLHCYDSFLNELKSWLTSKLKFLRIQEDMTLGLVFSSPLLTYNLLSASEFELLVSAVIFQKYTIAYVQEINLGEVELKALNPGGMQISKNMQFLTRLVLEILETVRQHLRHHFVKFTRMLIRELKNKFYSLLFERMSARTPGRGEPSEDEIVNYSDLVQVQGLKEFLLYGLGPVVKSRTSTYIAFSSFFYLNSARIRFLVESYKFD